MREGGGGGAAGWSWLASCLIFCYPSLPPCAWFTLRVFNEVNGFWNGGRGGYFTPYEYAAMLSAAYDGHAGALGPGYGARTADPSIKVAMSGLSAQTGIIGINFDYLEAMHLWVLHNRPNRDFPAQAINVHM